MSAQRAEILARVFANQRGNWADVRHEATSHDQGIDY